jgi:hypothetical protein
MDNSRLQAEDDDAAKHAQRLINDALEADGVLLIFARSNNEIGSMMMGDEPDIISMVGTLAEKEPAIQDLVVKMFMHIIAFNIHKLHGDQGVNEFYAFMKKILAPTLPTNKAEC